MATRSEIFDGLWLLTCITASSLWCLTAAAQLSATYDEPTYVALGLERWRTGSYGEFMRKGTMPLPVDVQTLPLYLVERSRGRPFDPVADLDRLLPWARAGTLVFWGVLLIYGWQAGRHLAGPWGGRVTVALLASEPTLLAHASLATTDLAVSACLLALLFHFRLGREAAWTQRVGLPAVWFAAAGLAKASGVILGLVGLTVVELERLLWAGAFRDASAVGLQARLRHGWGRLRPLWHDLVQIAGLGMVLVFLYCGSDGQANRSLVAWARGWPEGGIQGTLVWGAEHLRLFPNAGDALARVARDELRGSGAFLLGRVYREAVWYYFPVALTIKLTLPVLALAVLTALCRIRVLGNWAFVTACTWLLLSLTFRVQIGIRLILPFVALAIVGVASAATRAWREWASAWGGRLLAVGLGAGVIWTVTAAIRVWPHGLCYTNELWGGTAKGYRLLSDSNYDWGQGLKDLARWQREHGLPGLDVWYFGSDPSVRTLPMREVPREILMGGPEALRAYARGRYLAVSTTLLYGKLRTTSEQRVAAFLRTRRPAARTMTFSIYDFTQEADEGDK